MSPVPQQSLRAAWLVLDINDQVILGAWRESSLGRPLGMTLRGWDSPDTKGSG